METQNNISASLLVEAAIVAEQPEEVKRSSGTLPEKYRKFCEYIKE